MTKKSKSKHKVKLDLRPFYVGDIADTKSIATRKNMGEKTVAGCSRENANKTARTVDHRFSTFAELRAFARGAKQAGVSTLMLVGVNKIGACPGSWYLGLRSGRSGRAASAGEESVKNMSGAPL